MKNACKFLALVLILSMNIAQSQSTSSVKNYENGWRTTTIQVDPFDKRKVQIIQITKNDFTFRCGEINMNAPSSGIESLNISAELKYIIDEQDTVDKIGNYSTYLGGSSMVTEKRFYSMRLSDVEIEALKNGKKLKLAAKFRGIGWTNKELALNGFASVYDEMCK